MRVVLIAVGLLLSIVAARAERVVASGRPLILYHAYSTNPDCTSLGSVVMRVAQAPEHGRVSIHHAGVFPNFPAGNLRSACNRRRVPAVEATYVSQRGYMGYDTVVLEVLYPTGSGRRVTVSIRVM